ncbi:hypothetical protein BDM02DRAFT_3190950 [Thelephora ganbajun]|uniref:Uncharacterized protein n=1 Tax=Thelephora ganbajun TaxID=370292 RepID=A0ACB6Z430_THEGA|nr:hypothetical protein BDM02DRAFT_3190950 [Thelephora ganbajun]
MRCQWSTSYRIGDDPIRSAQHECRFPTIIQLEEVAPPPPPSQKALFSPVPSSSHSCDYYSSSEEYEEVEGEEEEEATESYCSSDPSCPGFGMGDQGRASAMASTPVEQKVKMSRVLAWRNSFDGVFAEDSAGLNFPNIKVVETVEDSLVFLIVIVVSALSAAASATAAVRTRSYVHLFCLRCVVPGPRGTSASF